MPAWDVIRFSPGFLNQGYKKLGKKTQKHERCLDLYWYQTPVKMNFKKWLKNTKVKNVKYEKYNTI